MLPNGSSSQALSRSLSCAVTKNGKRTVEVVYLIISADHHSASAPVLAT